jgi:hypothetical protein
LKLAVAQIIKKFASFYGTLKFITNMESAVFQKRLYIITKLHGITSQFFA